jgi:hypothetical protein
MITCEGGFKEKYSIIYGPLTKMAKVLKEISYYNLDILFPGSGLGDGTQ